MTAKKPKVFYVYILRDPRPGKDMQPIYVGKGKGRRAHKHWHVMHHRNPLLHNTFGKIRKAGLEVVVEIVSYFDVEAEAFKREIELIAKYGRRNDGTGILRNLSNGGEGPAGCLGLYNRFQTEPDLAQDYAERLRQRNQNPEFSGARIAGFRRYFDTSETAKYHADQARARADRLKDDPQWIEANLGGIRRRCGKPGWTEAQSARACELNSRPAFKVARSRQMTQSNTDPEIKKKRAIGVQRYWAKRRGDPHWTKEQASMESITRAARKEAHRLERMRNPEYAEAQRERWRVAWNKRNAKAKA
jgi:hypothetical protein